MTFPILAPTVTDNYNRLRVGVANLQSQCLGFRNAIGSGPVDVSQLIGFITNAIAVDKFISGLSPTSLNALAARYQQELNDPLFDFLSAGTAMQSALRALIAAIQQDYPVDAQSHPLDRTIDVNGNVKPVTITGASLPHVMQAITGWLATLG